MTAAEYQAKFAGKGTASARTPPRPTPSATQATSAAQGAEKAKPGLPVLPAPTSGTYPGPCYWLLGYGRATLRLAKPFEADRLRLVLACEPDEVLLAALIATAEAHFATTYPSPFLP